MEQNMPQSMLKFESDRLKDFKEIVLSLVNAEMYWQAEGIKEMSQVIEAVLNVNVSREVLTSNFCNRIK